MYRALFLAVLAGLFVEIANAAKFDGKGQGQEKIKKEAEIWSRLTNDEICDKLSQFKKTTSIYRKLNTERERRRILCK